VNSALGEYRTHPAYGPSILLHGSIVLAIVLGGWFFAADHPPAPQVFQLVAGAGDNYLATQATALGTEDAPKFDVPKMPSIPKPVTPQPLEQAQPDVQATPVQPAPLVQETAPAKPSASKSSATGNTTPNFVKSVRHAQIVAESRIKMHELRVKREQERERRIAERKAAAAAARKSGVSYEQFERQQASRGKATGVIHGASMEAGAGGKALTADQQDAMIAWTELIRERWRDNYESLATFPGNLKAHVTFFVGADGAISSIRVTSSSGNAEFDHTIVEALRYVKVPAPPVHKGDTYDIDFSSKGDDDE
jgi:colicin import membrane protein